MPEFHVRIEKKLACTGLIKVAAENSHAAVKQIRDRINTGTLQTTEVEWSTPKDEDDSLKCYGDVF